MTFSDPNTSLGNSCHLVSSCPYQLIMAVCQQEVVLQREPFPSPVLLHSFAVELSIFKLFKEEAAIFLKLKKFLFLYLGNSRWTWSYISVCQLTQAFILKINSLFLKIGIIHYFMELLQRPF